MVLGGALGPGLGRRGTNSRRGRFAWQAWHLVTSTLSPRHFTWQAWHKLTSTVVLRGRRGTHGTGWRPWARFRRA